jgi:hypothetical protein
MRKADIVTALLLMAGGLGLIFVIIPAFVGKGEEGDLAPGFMPVTAACLMVGLMGLLLVLRLVRGAGEDDDPPPLPAAAWRFLGLAFVVLAAGHLLMQFAGFLIAGALMIAAFMGLMRVGPLRVAAVALLGPLVIWGVFWQILGIPLP